MYKFDFPVSPSFMAIGMSDPIALANFIIGLSCLLQRHSAPPPNETISKFQRVGIKFLSSFWLY